MRSVGHAHRIRPAPDPGHAYERSGDFGAGSLEPFQAFFGGQDRRRSAVRHHTNIEPSERPRDHRRVAHILNAVTIAFLCVGVVVGVDMVLYRYLCHLLDGRAVFLHVTGDHHSVITGVEAADGVIPGNIRGQGDELVAFPGFNVAHRLEAICDAYIHMP